MPLQPTQTAPAIPRPADPHATSSGVASTRSAPADPLAGVPGVPARPVGDRHVELARLASEQQAHAALQASSDALLDVVRRSDETAQLRGPFVLSSAKLLAHDEAGHAAKSITVINYGAVAVYLGGPAGVGAGKSSQGLAVNGGRMLTLPIEVLDLDLAVDATDVAANVVVVYVLRHESVQPAYAGAL